MLIDHTGNAYREWNLIQRLWFIYGLMEGIVLHETIDIHPYGKDRIPNNTQNFITCMEDNFPIIGQIEKIIEKELNDHPENWNQPISIIIMSKFRTLCRERGYLIY